MGVAIGTGVGIALGVAMNEVGVLFISLGIGVVIGIALDAKARKEGRLCTREAGIAKGSIKMWVIIGVGVCVAITAFLLYYSF